jgi:hypothetical protein
MPRWFHEETEVKTILKNTLERIQPHQAVWDIPKIVDFIYQNASTPVEVSTALDKHSVLTMNAAINTLVNCGCSGARANLSQALRLFDSIATVNALTEGAKQMAINASVAIKQFIAVKVAKE